MTSSFRYVLLVGGLLPGLWSCARAPYHYQPPAEVATAAGVVPQLLFVSFRMTAEPRQIELLRAVAVAGEINAEAEEVSRDYLVITQLDAKQQPCGTATQLPHPLLSTIEFPAEKGNSLERRTVALPSAEFFVRLVRQPAAVAVRITEIAAGVSSPVSIVFPLTLSKP